jgi:hypothetical protein
MSSNYPPGVSEQTADAPWNDNTREVLVKACISKYITVPVNLTDEEISEIHSEEHENLMKELLWGDYEIDYLSIEF